jgi:hypothetical protein
VSLVNWIYCTDCATSRVVYGSRMIGRWEVTTATRVRKVGAEVIWRLTRSERHSVEVCISVTNFWVKANFRAIRYRNEMLVVTQVDFIDGPIDS